MITELTEKCYKVLAVALHQIKGKKVIKIVYNIKENFFRVFPTKNLLIKKKLILEIKIEIKG